MTGEALPAINAGLNATATLLLLVAYVTIRRRNYVAHGWLMGSAFIVSTCFLSFYLLHKYLLYQRTGSTNVSTAGLDAEWAWVRWVYLLGLLLPHLVLAIAMLPMILATFYLAWRRRWEKHRQLAQPTLWIWLYVSVSGVIIYFVLYHLFPRLMA